MFTWDVRKEACDHLQHGACALIASRGGWMDRYGKLLTRSKVSRLHWLASFEALRKVIGSRPYRKGLKCDLLSSCRAPPVSMPMPTCPSGERPESSAIGRGVEIEVLHIKGRKFFAPREGSSLHRETFLISDQFANDEPQKAFVQDKDGIFDAVAI